jgi:hypothetical protein
VKGMCERNRPDVLVCDCFFLSFVFWLGFGVLAAVILWIVGQDLVALSVVR